MSPPSFTAKPHAALVALALFKGRGKHTLPDHYLAGPGLREQPGFPKNWTCWRPAHRDSDALERSNARVGTLLLRDAAIADGVEDLEEQIIDGTASHFLVGHIREVFVRLLRPPRPGEQDDIDAGPLHTREQVVEACGLDPATPWRWTGAACAMVQILGRLEKYPILDESDFSAEELDEQLEEIRHMYPRPRVETPWPVSLEDIHRFICEVRGEYRPDAKLVERALLAGGAVPDEELCEQAARQHLGLVHKRGRWYLLTTPPGETPVTRGFILRRRSRSAAERALATMTANVIRKHAEGTVTL